MSLIFQDIETAYLDMRGRLRWPLQKFSSLYKAKTEKPTGLVLEFKMWRNFDTKQKSKSLCLIVFDHIVYSERKFLISEVKNGVI